MSRIEWEKINTWGERFNTEPKADDDKLKFINAQIAIILTQKPSQGLKDWAAKRAKEIMRGK